MARYFVQFSATPNFAQSSDTYRVLPGTGVTGTSYTPTAGDWKQVKTIASTSGGLIYWRVKGQDASGAFEIWSTKRAFTIFGGTITLQIPVPNGDGTVVQDQPSPTWSWNYAGSGFYKFYLQFSTRPDFGTTNRTVTTVFLPGTGTTLTSIRLSTTQWNRVLDLISVPGDTIYWRVKAVDQDNVFYILTPASTFIWQ
jgi:hypothetical protein